MQPTSDHERGTAAETSPLIDEGAPPLTAQRAGQDPAPVPPPHRPAPDTPETEIIPKPHTEVIPDQGDAKPEEVGNGAPEPPPAPMPDPTVPPTPDVPPPPG